MTSAAPRNIARRRHKRLRSPRRLLLFFLALGLTGLCLGTGLVIASFTQNNGAFLTYGLCYLAGSAAIFGLRAAVRVLHELRKRKHTGTSAA